MSSLHVEDVIELNDCAGKKTIYAVVPGGESSQVKNVYEMTSTWLPSFVRLELGMVSPQDEIEVVNRPDTTTFLIHRGKTYLNCGEFTRVISGTVDREPLCKCSKRLVTDGYNLYCSDVNCVLSICTRLDRLANTSFSSINAPLNHQSISDWFSSEDHQNFAYPFRFIVDPKFWGYNDQNFINDHKVWGYNEKYIEDIFLKEDIAPQLSQFLVRDLFEEILSDQYFKLHLTANQELDIINFFGSVGEAVNRRDFNNLSQNRFLAMFLYALGIESLKPSHIKAIINHECNLQNEDPFVIYSFFLSRADEMEKELGFHPLEANAIVNEVYRRRFELADIFNFYAINKEDITLVPRQYT